MISQSGTSEATLLLLLLLTSRRRTLLPLLLSLPLGLVKCDAV
jgi:hypothetical protein